MSREIVPAEVFARIRRTIGSKKKKDLAAVLGISQQALYMQEQRGTLLLDQLWKICNKYSVTMDWLLSGEEIGRDSGSTLKLENVKLEKYVGILERHIDRLERDNERMRKELGFTEEEEESLLKPQKP